MYKYTIKFKDGSTITIKTDNSPNISIGYASHEIDVSFGGDGFFKYSEIVAYWKE